MAISRWRCCRSRCGPRIVTTFSTHPADDLLFAARFLIAGPVHLSVPGRIMKKMRWRSVPDAQSGADAP